MKSVALIVTLFFHVSSAKALCLNAKVQVPADQSAEVQAEIAQTCSIQSATEGRLTFSCTSEQDMAMAVVNLRLNYGLASTCK